MNENIVVGEVGAEGVEVIDYGDAMVETKQPHPFQMLLDSCCTWTYNAFE